MQREKGVSLVILVIIIVVLTIITGIVIREVSSLLQKSTKEDFVSEISTIQASVKEYYLANGSLPVDTINMYDATSILDVVTTPSDRIHLTSEIANNKDSDNYFYKINLQDIAVTTNERGKEANADDIFVVSTNTLNVYYLRGETIEGVKYYSNVKLINTSNIVSSNSTPLSPVELSDHMSLQKSINTWTNMLTVKVNAKLEEGQSLTYVVAGNTSGEKAVPANREIPVKAGSFTASERTEIITNPTLVVNKKDANGIVETQTISLDNIDFVTPAINNIVVTDHSNEKYNIIKINCIEETSGMKCIYYDYYEKKLADGTITSYYSGSVINKDSIMNYGKISKDGTIKLDKNISSIGVVLADNAGNTSYMLTQTVPDTYVIGW